jgi:hypothetical protein
MKTIAYGHSKIFRPEDFDPDICRDDKGNNLFDPPIVPVGGLVSR